MAKTIKLKDGEHINKSYFEWTILDSDFKENKAAINATPKDKEDVLYCYCGSTEVRLYTVEDSAKIQDIVIKCVKCGCSIGIADILKLTHSA